MMLKVLFIAGMSMSWLLADASAQTTSPAVSLRVDHRLLDQILQKRVHHGRVDYLGIRAHDAVLLKNYLKMMAGVPVVRLSRNEQLAYYINVYNATMIQAIVTRYHKGYRPSEHKFSVFSDKLVHLASGIISLNDLENKVIRPTFKDPRIHVALVCGAVSCPPLLSRAYRGCDLDAVLTVNMKRFINEQPDRNRIDDARRVLHLSQVFNWYADDFGGAKQVWRYIQQYHGGRLADYKVEFMSYDWSLNIMP